MYVCCQYGEYGRRGRCQVRSGSCYSELGLPVSNLEVRSGEEVRGGAVCVVVGVAVIRRLVACREGICTIDRPERLGGRSGVVIARSHGRIETSY